MMNTGMMNKQSDPVNITVPKSWVRVSIRKIAASKLTGTEDASGLLCGAIGEHRHALAGGLCRSRSGLGYYQEPFITKVMTVQECLASFFVTFEE